MLFACHFIVFVVVVISDSGGGTNSNKVWCMTVFPMGLCCNIVKSMASVQLGFRMRFWNSIQHETRCAAVTYRAAAIYRPSRLGSAMDERKKEMDDALMRSNLPSTDPSIRGCRECPFYFTLEPSFLSVQLLFTPHMVDGHRHFDVVCFFSFHSHLTKQNTESEKITI